MTYHDHKPVDWTKRESLILPGEYSIPLTEWRRRRSEQAAQLRRLDQQAGNAYKTSILSLHALLDESYHAPE